MKAKKLTCQWVFSAAAWKASLNL